jgi:hypothetical protein
MRRTSLVVAVLVAALSATAGAEINSFAEARKGSLHVLSSVLVSGHSVDMRGGWFNTSPFMHNLAAPPRACRDPTDDRTQQRDNGYGEDRPRDELRRRGPQLRIHDLTIRSRHGVP